MCETGAGCDAPGQCLGCVGQRFGRHNLVVKSPAMAFVGGHRPARKQQFRSAALPDDPGQNRTGPHIAPSQPNPGEQECATGAGRGDAQVGGHGDDRAGTHTNPINRCDNRLAAMDHRFDQITGHPGKGQKLFHVHPGQWADDVMHIAARTEITAVRRKNHSLNFVGIGQIAKPVAQFGVTGKGQWVFAIRPVKGDGGDTAVDVAFEMADCAAHGHIERPLRLLSRTSSRADSACASAPVKSPNIASIHA